MVHYTQQLTRKYKQQNLSLRRVVWWAEEVFFRWRRWGCFSDGGASFLSMGVSPMGDFDGGRISKKIVGWGECAHPPSCLPPTIGNPACICYQNMHVNYFFMWTSHWKLRKVSAFVNFFLMLTLKKFYFVYVIYMHMISQPLYIVYPSEMWTCVRQAGVQKFPIASFHV